MSALHDLLNDEYETRVEYRNKVAREQAEKRKKWPTAAAIERILDSWHIMKHIDESRNAKQFSADRHWHYEICMWATGEISVWDQLVMEVF